MWGVGWVLRPPGDGSLAGGMESILAVLLAWFISQLPGTGPGYRGSSRPPAGRRQRNRAVVGEPGEEAQVKAQRHHPGAPRCGASGQGRVGGWREPCGRGRGLVRKRGAQASASPTGLGWVLGRGCRGSDSCRNAGSRGLIIQVE